MSPIDYCLYSTKLFFTLLVRKNLYLKFLYNKFFSIYNYLFRFFCLFGFQWTVFTALLRKSVSLLLCKILYLNHTAKKAYARVILVGPSGLEPPTSCLSGTRSNLLSYDPMWYLAEVVLITWLTLWWRWWDSNSFATQTCTHRKRCWTRGFSPIILPWWRWWDSNPWPPACRAGALPAELHPHLLNEFRFSPFFLGSGNGFPFPVLCQRWAIFPYSRP